MATTKTEEGVHVLSSGNTFERPLTVNEPCAFSFAFSVDGNLPLEFSVMLRAKGKDMQLLPASRYAELDGEVLLPGAGTCIARWHNPSGWVFNAPAATLYFKLQVLKQTPMPALKSPAAAPAPPAPAEPASAEPVEPPSPEPPSSAMLAAIDAAVEVAKAKAAGAATAVASEAGAAEAARAKAAAAAQAEEAAAAAAEQAAAAEAAKAEAEAEAEAAKAEAEAEAAAMEAAKAEAQAAEAAAAASAALSAAIEAAIEAEAAENPGEAPPPWVPSTSSVASWVTHEGLLQKRTSASVPAGGTHEV
jgi:hypothetical protein